MVRVVAMVTAGTTSGVVIVTVVSVVASGDGTVVAMVTAGTEWCC